MRQGEFCAWARWGGTKAGCGRVQGAVYAVRPRMRPPATAKAHHHYGLAWLLAALSALGPFSTDTYLPSMPELSTVFGVPLTLVQQTLTAYMVPFAVMTLWQGAISDALGRRRVTLVMLLVFTVASLGCMVAWRIEVLIAFRALQGMSAGAGMVIGRAVVRDLLDGAEARRLMARVAVVFAIAPAAGPVLGGWLHVWFGWRSVFAFLLLYAFALWGWCWRRLPETLPPEQRQPLRVGALLRSYRQVGGSAPFVALVLSVTLNFSAMFLYIISAPMFIMTHLGLTETDFLWLFGPITGGLLIGTWLSGRLAHTLSNHRTVLLAYGFMLAAALGNVGFHFLRPPAVPWSVVPLVVYVIGSSLAMPSLTLMALDLFPRQRGMASSCQGFVQSGGNAIVTALVAPWLWGSVRTMALGQLVLLGGGMLAYGLYWRIRRSGGASPDGDEHAVGVERLRPKKS